MTHLSRAWSDSSGFLDGDSETYLSRQNGTASISESSQCVGSSATHVTTVPSCASCDILKSELVVSVNASDEKQDFVACPTDSGITSPNEECTLRNETGLSAINQQNLPNNLFQELSSVNDWLDVHNVPHVDECVCDVSGSCAILHTQQTSRENLRITEVSDRQNSGVKDEAGAHSSRVSNRMVPCTRSAISPRVQASACACQDSSSERTLPGNHIPPAHPSVCTDDSDSTRHRTMSLHTIGHGNSLLFGRVRRVRSAPQCLQHMASSDDITHCSSWSSVSNMFSFCSDESVIHVGLQKSGSSRSSEKRPSDGLCKPQCDSGLTDVGVKDQSDSIADRCYLKPCALPCGKNTRSGLSDVPVTGLNQLVGELAVSSLSGSSDMDVSHSLCCWNTY